MVIQTILISTTISKKKINRHEQNNLTALSAKPIIFEQNNPVYNKYKHFTLYAQSSASFSFLSIYQSIYSIFKMLANISISEYPIHNGGRENIK